MEFGFLLNGNLKQKVIYFTEWKSEADVIIYFSDWKSEAGWKKFKTTLFLLIKSSSLRTAFHSKMYFLYKNLSATCSDTPVVEYPPS